MRDIYLIETKKVIKSVIVMYIWKLIKATFFFVLCILLVLFTAHYNTDLFLFFNQSVLQELGDLWFYITFIGDGSVVIILILFLYLRKDRYFSLDVPFVIIGLLSQALSGSGIQILKNTIKQVRPIMDLYPYSIHITGPALGFNAFPSGHSGAALATAALFFLYYKNNSYRWLWLAAGCLIAMSRVMVGVHWPLDIVVGSIIGYASTHIVYQLRPHFENSLDFWQRKATSLHLKLELTLQMLLLVVCIALIHYVLFLDAHIPLRFKDPIAVVGFFYTLYLFNRGKNIILAIFT